MNAQQVLDEIRLHAADNDLQAIRDALEDGEALAKLNFTDADQSAIEEAHAFVCEAIAASANVLFDMHFDVVARNAAKYPEKIVIHVCQHSNPWQVGSEVRFDIDADLHAGKADSLSIPLAQQSKVAPELFDKFMLSARAAARAIE